MSFVHDVRGMVPCTKGFGLLGSKLFDLEDVAWRYQGIRNIVDALSQESTRFDNFVFDRRLGRVFK